MKNKGILYLFAFFLLSTASAAATTQDEYSVPAKLNLGLELVASGLTNPVLVTAPREDERHIFIVEQAGRILVLEDGALMDRPFLDISAKVSFGGEQGLLGLAFDPNYSVNRRFYVDYTDANGNTVVSSFLRHGKKETRALHRSERVILRVNQPFANHNAGHLEFGPDGYLYAALGDGGSGGDPLGNGQNLKTLLGSLLRIDVSIYPYSIPSTNPFVNPVKTGVIAQPEIWAFGLRNPWRFSFDRETGDLYIADVGQSSIEEINFQPAAGSGGRNYGWNVMEGNQDYAGGSRAGLTMPIYTYTHNDGNCSVTGGYVYRGGIKALRGHYFFADYCSGRIWSFKYLDGSVQQFTERTDDLRTPEGGKLRFISSFGQDAGGELYICELENGNVYKIVRK
jgi:glucose/arabinose dehydrogenase